MSLKAFAIALMAPLQLGAGMILRVVSDDGSPMDPVATNVYYDLACLYGDADGDGALSKEERDSFEIDSLAPEGLLGEDTGFKFLGFYPTSDEMLFYVWTPFRIDDAVPEDGFASSYSYIFNYQNSSVVDLGSASGYSGDIVRTCNPTFCNSYQAADGVFSKFAVEDYVPSRNGDGLMRIKAKELRVLDSSGGEILSADVGDGSELIYDDSVVDEDPMFRYYEENVYQIDVVTDCFLSTSKQEAEGFGFLFWNVVTGHGVKEANEITYVFFNFPGDFQPDQIKEVNWACVVTDFTQTHYYSYQRADPNDSDISIYDGKVSDPQGSLRIPDRDEVSGTNVNTWGDVDWGETFEDAIFVDSTRSLRGTTTAGTMVFEQEDTPFWDSGDVVRRYNTIETIVRMSEVGSLPDTEEYGNFKEFMESSDHLDYQWAYAITDPSLVRSIVSDTSLGSYHFGPSSNPSTYVHRRVTRGHELSGIVTLGMTVVEEGREFDIAVMNDPATVRDNFLIGFDSPWPEGIYLDPSIPEWAVWLGLAVLCLIALFVLSIFFPILKGVLRGLLYAVEFVLDAVYIVLVWWWLAIIRKARGEDIPPLWPFGKGE